MTTFYTEGYDAFNCGMGFLDNPYLDRNLTHARIWIDGYVQALIDARVKAHAAAIQAAVIDDPRR